MEAENFLFYIFFLVLFKKHTLLLINALCFIIIKFTLLIDKVFFIFNDFLTGIVTKCVWYTVVLQLSFPCVILLLSRFCFATRETVYMSHVDTGFHAPSPPIKYYLFSPINVLYSERSDECFSFTMISVYVYTINSWYNVSIFNSRIFSGWEVNLVGTLK